MHSEMRSTIQLIRPNLVKEGDRIKLAESFEIRKGVILEALEMSYPKLNFNLQGVAYKQLKYRLEKLECKIDREVISELFSRTLVGGGLSDLNVVVKGAQLEVSGLLSSEGYRTPFLVRGFMWEDTGPYGGVIFFDTRWFGYSRLPAPALLTLLAARTGRHGPINLEGCAVIHFDLPSLVLQWGLSVYGWKIPSYRDIKLIKIQEEGEYISFKFGLERGSDFRYFASSSPEYPQWKSFYEELKRYAEIEEKISHGEYAEASDAYAQEFKKRPQSPFLQKRLLQLYLASKNSTYIEYAQQLARKLFTIDPENADALFCLAQYSELKKSYHAAANYYRQLGELAVKRGNNVEASLAFGKAAELFERLNSEHAQKLWKLAVEHNPKYRLAITALTRHALKNQRYREAEKILLQLIEQTPPGLEKGRYHLSLAGLYRSRLRELDKAGEQLQKASYFLHEDFAYLRELIEYRLATDENIGALRLLDRLAQRAKKFKQAPLLADLLFRSGQILEERLGQPERALYRYNLALEVRQNFREALEKISKLREQGIEVVVTPLGFFENPDLLIPEKEKALERYKDVPYEQLRLYLELAKLYLQKEQREKAVESLKKVIELDPHNSAAWRILTELAPQMQLEQELAELHYKIARDTQEPEQAIYHLEEALKFKPSDRNILKLLSDLYEKVGEWEKLNTLLSRWLEIAEPDEVSDLLLRRAKIQGEKLQRMDLAEISYIRAIQMAPNPLQYAKALLEFYVALGWWDRLELQIKHLAQQLDEKQQAELYATIGNSILKYYPNQKEKALENYKRAIQLDEDNLQYLLKTIEIYRELKKYTEELPLLQKATQLTEDPAQEISLRRELLHITLDYLNRPAEALPHLRRIVELEPDNLENQLLFAQAVHQLGEYSVGAEVLSKSLENISNKPYSENLVQLLKLMVLIFQKAEKTEWRDKAVQNLLGFGAKLRLKPTLSLPFPSNVPEENTAQILFAVGIEFRSPQLLLEATKLLAKLRPTLMEIPLREALSIAPFAPEIWLYRLKNTPPEHRKSVLAELKDALSSKTIGRGEEEQLRELFSKLQGEELSSEELKPLIETVAQKGLRFSSLTSLYASALEREGQIEEALNVRSKLLEDLPKGEEHRDLLFELAIQEIQLLGNREGGLEKLWRLLREYPGDRDALAELQQLYDEEGDLEGFVSKLLETVRVLPPSRERSELFINAYELKKALEPEPENLRQFLEQFARDCAQDDPYTLQALAVAYEELEDWPAAAELYKKIIQIPETPEEILSPALEQAIYLYHKQLDNPEVAIEILSEFLEQNPGRPRALELLSEIYEEFGMWMELAQLIESQVPHVKDEELAGKYLLKLGEIYFGRLEDYQSALNAYRRALRLNPKNIRALQALHALYEELENWNGAVSALKAIANLTVDRDKLFHLYLKIAQFYIEKIPNFKEAEKYLLLAADQDNNSVEVYQKLLKLYTENKQWEKAAETAVQLAIITAKQKDLDKAKEALSQLAEISINYNLSSPPQVMLKKVLEERQESAAFSKELLDILSEIIGIPLEVEIQLSTFQLIKNLYKRGLVELSWLIRLWSSSDEEFPAPEGFDRLLESVQREDWNSAINYLNGLLDMANAEEIPSYQLAIGEIYLYALRDSQSALASAKTALSMGAPPERALSIVESIYEVSERNPQFEALSSIARSIPPEEERPRALYHLGSIYLKNNLLPEAFLLFLDGYSLTPRGGELAHLPPHLYQLYKSPDVAIPPPAELTIQQKNLIQAFIAFQQGQNSLAYSALKQFLESDPDCSPALRILGHYLFQQHQVEQTIAIIYHFLELEWENLPFDEVVENCLTLASLYAVQKKWEDALFYIEQAAKFIPEDPRILKLHIQVLTSAEQWEELKLLYESHIESPEPTDDIAQILFELGQLYENIFKDDNKAVACYRQALVINAGFTEARNRFEALKKKLQKPAS